VRRIADRERSPMYVVGETTGDMQFVFEQPDGQRPLDMQLNDFFGKPPRTVMHDTTLKEGFKAPEYDSGQISTYLNKVLQLEAVACKEWLTNKVDRSVTGKVARQQCQGEIQLPLSDLGAVALDYRGKTGIATSIGHAPQAALVDAAAGSVLAIAEALTNLVFAPLKGQMSGVSLSANWMWPCKNPGEDARLYEAVEACSKFACELGINIPTGKDSLSMTQKYGEEKIYSPGTVIISAGAEVSDIRKIVSPVVKNDPETTLYYLDFSKDTLQLGGSALAQSLNRVGDRVPSVRDTASFKTAFNAVQDLVEQELILAGHDISAGGMITTLLEMCFGNVSGGLAVDLDALARLYEQHNGDEVRLLFAENPAIIIQVREKQQVENYLSERGVSFAAIAHPISERTIRIQGKQQVLDIDALRDVWYRSSFLLDRLQSGETCARARYENYKQQPLHLRFLPAFTGTLRHYGLAFDRPQSGVKAAIIREKGTNGEREMAYSLYLAGFDVKDVHTTDLVSGRETLDDVNLIVFCGGFSNSDVLGSAKGWADRKSVV
jgi:phosphoribosylformylglycinamidine synthase